MSIQIIAQPKQPTPEKFAVPAKPPPLNAGDRLPRAEFERRYQAHPEIKRAELIEGVVYMPSPTRFEQHGEPHGQMVTWLGVYAAASFGVRVVNNTTVRLDFENEVQPDAFLCIKTELGGQTQVSQDDYLKGPPEPIVEIAASSASYDLHDKKRVYARSGVREYLVVQMYDRRVDWFVLREGVYQNLLADETGILHSEVFPGLWLQPTKLWANDLAGMLELLQIDSVDPNLLWNRLSSLFARRDRLESLSYKPQKLDLLRLGYAGTYQFCRALGNLG
jgi:Uma2 family endonuclease